MDYTFWDYLPGLIIIGILASGIIGAIAIQITVGIAGMFFSVVGVRTPDKGKTMTIKENYYDYDEDY